MSRSVRVNHATKIVRQELHYRATKVAALLSAIDQTIGTRGGEEAEIIAAFLEALDDRGWRALAEYSSVYVPGPKSRALVIELIRARGLELAVNRPGPVIHPIKEG